MLLYCVNYGKQSYKMLLKMQPLNVQTLSKDPKQAPQLFSMKMKSSQRTISANRLKSPRQEAKKWINFCIT